MPGKVAVLGIEIGIGPFEAENGGREIVEVEVVGDAAEMSEGILDAAQEGLGVLPEDGLAVGPAGETQDDAENPGAAPGTVGSDNWGRRPRSRPGPPRRVEPRCARPARAGAP